MCTSKILLLIIASLSTGGAVNHNCWVCADITKEDCLANRVSERCESSSVCLDGSVSLLNTTSGKTTIMVKKSCTLKLTCAYGKQLCDGKNKTALPPMKMTACSYTCCTSGPDCVNVTANATTTAAAPTTKPPGDAFTTSPWATDMGLCKAMCCDATHSQTWQNRTCCPSLAGGCLGVELTKEIKCEDSYCNEKHCGASQLGRQMSMIVMAAILHIVIALSA